MRERKNSLRTGFLKLDSYEAQNHVSRSGIKGMAKIEEWRFKKKKKERKKFICDLENIFCLHAPFSACVTHFHHQVLSESSTESTTRARCSFNATQTPGSNQSKMDKNKIQKPYIQEFDRFARRTRRVVSSAYLHTSATANSAVAPADRYVLQQH